MTNTTPLAQQALQEELEAVRHNIYTDQYDRVSVNCCQCIKTVS